MILSATILRDGADLLKQLLGYSFAEDHNSDAEVQNSKPTVVLPVIMIGARGVGKSSVLTSMWTELEALFKKMREEDPDNFKAKLYPALEHVAEFEDKRNKLMGYAQQEGLKVTAKGLDPNSDLEQYKIKIDIDGDKKADIEFVFNDLPGGWWTGRGEEADFKDLKKVFENSIYSIVAIDSTGLMEHDGEHNDYVNGCRTIVQVLSNLSENRENNGRTCIFVLCRAEKYLHENRRKELIDKFEVAYGEILELFKADGGINYVCAVETVGCLECNAMTVNRDDERNKTVEIEFMRTRGEYMPVSCELPIMLILKDALVLAKGMKTGNNIPWLNVLFGRINGSKHFESFINKLDARIKQTALN